jgi:hypothetical protein
MDVSKLGTSMAKCRPSCNLDPNRVCAPATVVRRSSALSSGVPPPDTQTAVYRLLHRVCSQLQPSQVVGARDSASDSRRPTALRDHAHAKTLNGQAQSRTRTPSRHGRHHGRCRQQAYYRQGPHSTAQARPVMFKTAAAAVRDKSTATILARRAPGSSRTAS